MKNRVLLLVGSMLALGSVSAPASAQDYFMRERVEGLKPAANPSTTFTWAVGGWSGWSSTCSDNSIRTRRVACTDGDGQVVNDEACSATKPSASETQAIRTGCLTYSWQSGEWSDWSSHCSDNAQRTRTVSCAASNGTTAADAMCSGTKPEMSETAAITDQCPPPPPTCQPGIVSVIPDPNLGAQGGSNNGYFIEPLGMTAETKRSVWMIGNYGNTTNRVRLSSYGPNPFRIDANIPPKTKVIFYSTDGAVDHSFIAYTQYNGIITTGAKRPTSTIFKDCR